jgi:hypothetical protein
MKFFSLLILTGTIASPCGCIEAPVRSKFDHANIVFRGTIVELKAVAVGTGLSSGFGNDTGKTVVFRVTRVWKGEVAETFSMPEFLETSACIGFWPSYVKVGNELLVYAREFGKGSYVTSICGSHKLVKDAEKDFKELGDGRPPSKPRP